MKETNKTQGIKDAQPKKRKQAISKSYLVKSFKNVIEKLEETKLISEEDLKTLTEIHAKTVTNWIEEMGV